MGIQIGFWAVCLFCLVYPYVFILVMGFSYGYFMIAYLINNEVKL